jgi:hypothetical protein
MAPPFKPITKQETRPPADPRYSTTQGDPRFNTPLQVRSLNPGETVDNADQDDQRKIDEMAARIRLLAQPTPKAEKDEHGHKHGHKHPKHGTRAAADAHLASMPDAPGGQKGAKLIDRPMTTGASG